MVSNEEIKHKLGDRREGIGTEGYFVCDNCKGSYELQNGEKPEDFDTQCECGSKLRFFNNLNEDEVQRKINDNPKPHDKDETPKLTGKLVLLTIFSVVISGILFPIGTIIAGILIWWIFFHKNVRITQSNQNNYPKSKILKGVLYCALLLVVVIFYLSQAYTLYVGSAFLGMIIFGGVVVLFLLLRHFLNR